MKVFISHVIYFNPFPEYSLSALGVGMDEAVAGAWIGASVDQTGNVIAAAAIVSKYATEVAKIVKIVLNSG